MICERGRLAVRTDRAGVRFGFEHAVDADGKVHLHRIGLFVGERLHPHDRLAVFDRLHAPIDARLAAGRDFDRARRLAQRGQRLALQLEHDADRFGRFQMVMHVGREDDFVRLDKEPRRLHPQQQVLRRDDLGLSLPDARAGRHRPAADLPSRKIFGHGKRDFDQTVAVGFEAGGPEGRVGKLRADRRLGLRALRRPTSFPSLFLTPPLQSKSVGAVGAGDC